LDFFSSKNSEREQRAKENESQSQSKSIPHLSIRINPRLELPEVPISTVSITSPPLNSKESTPPFCKQYAVSSTSFLSLFPFFFPLLVDYLTWL